MIVVDTNVWSELTKDEPAPNVLAWLEAHEAQLLLSPIVLAEIRVGVETAPTGSKRQKLEEWCLQLQQDYGSRTVDFEIRAAHVLGHLVAQRKLQKQDTKMLDLLIASQALAFDLPVATRNTRDFEWTGVRLVDPWQA